MRYANITTCDIANGKELGVVLWCQGCSLACPGCHNYSTQSTLGGKEFTKDTETIIFNELKRPQIKRFTLSGGHPLEPYNINTCTNLCKRIKAEMPEIKIWCYTGYLWENISNLEIMKYIDVLVDGPYEEQHRDISLPWRGSTNQRVIDVKKSTASHLVLIKDS